MSTYYCNDCCERHESTTGACPRTITTPAAPTATAPCPRCGGDEHLGVAPICGACIAAGIEAPAKPSPAWAWVTPSADLTRGTLDDGIVHAYATVLLNHALVTIRCEGNALELSTTLPAWSQSQQRRWVEQWVASQSDAAVAAFEATEGMR